MRKPQTTGRVVRRKAKKSSQEGRAQHAANDDDILGTRALPLSPEDSLLEMRDALKQLPFSEKLALFGASALLLSTLLPWKETSREGEVLGVSSSGLGVTFLAGIAISSFLIRKRAGAIGVSPRALWAIQFGSLSLAGLWCVVYLTLSWDPTLARSPIGNFEMWVSQPSIGLMLALLAEGIATVGTVLGLKEMSR